ncbi:MAG TPA: hypothetical protein DEG47_16155, partial [Cyanobacteria bacterium UBA11148]|nr:hypothetical protein [Cyanobacteria bacterium UBA11148]
MVNLKTRIEKSPLVLHLSPVINLTDEQFFEFCQLNPDLRIERSKLPLRLEVWGYTNFRPPARTNTS